jgi:DNA-binding response OmpR family regulator
MPSAKILVIDDEPSILNLVTSYRGDSNGKFT